MTEVETRLAALETRLRQHDWYYVYSDDPGVNRRGFADKSAIELESTQLRQLGYKNEVDALWEQHRPRM